MDGRSMREKLKGGKGSEILLVGTVYGGKRKDKRMTKETVGREEGQGDREGKEENRPKGIVKGASHTMRGYLLGVAMREKGDKTSHIRLILIALPFTLRFHCVRLSFEVFHYFTLPCSSAIHNLLSLIYGQGLSFL